MSCKGFEYNGICFPIHLVEIDWSRIGPQPDPWGEIFDDVRTLATINEGIKTITDERIRTSMFEAVQGAARSMKLPEGVKLGDGLFTLRSGPGRHCPPDASGSVGSTPN